MPEPTHPSAPAVPVELQRKPEQAPGIGRRAVLQSLVGGLGAGLALPGLAGAQHHHPVHAHLADQGTVTAADEKAAATDYKPEFLDAHQLETLDLLAERIVPGSREANVAPFIDQLLAVDNHANQRNFLGALGAMEMLAIDRFSKPWKGITPAQQDELLTHASTAQTGMKDTGTDRAPRMEGRRSIRDHFENLRGWISGAYYSSEQGMSELGWTGEMFFEKLPGCEHPGGHG
jgi:hypothetical protein